MPKKPPAKRSASSSAGTPGKKAKVGNGKGNGNNDPLKPSPFAKNKPRTPVKKGPVTVKAYHVVPNVSGPDEEGYTGHEFLVGVVEGWFQKKVVDCVYLKNSNDNAMAFFEASDPVPHVFEMYDEDEEVTTQAVTGIHYNVKIIVHTLNGDEPATEEEIKTFFNDTFIPGLMMQSGVKKTTPKPVLHPTEFYNKCLSWSKVIGNGDGPVNLFKFGGYRTHNETFGDWIKSDKTNLYSVWQIGKIPANIKTQYGLTNEHMYPADWGQAITNGDAGADDEQADDDDDGQENDDVQDDDQADDNGDDEGQTDGIEPKNLDDKLNGAEHDDTESSA